MNLGSLFHYLLGTIPDTAPRRFERGTPLNVLRGCVPEVFVIPDTEHAATTRKGQPLMARNKRGQLNRVVDRRGMDMRLWKKRVYDEQRRAAGRFVGTFGGPVKKAV